MALFVQRLPSSFTWSAGVAVIGLIFVSNEVVLASPRQAPFCVDTGEDADPAVVRFKPIFDFHNLNDEFVPVSSDKTKHTSPNGFIEKIELWRVSVNSVPVDHSLEVLRQWMHIHVTSANALEGLYLQVIAGPLGVPKGEFRLDFDCIDCQVPTSSLDATVVGCRYRPFSSMRHPSVMAVGGRNTSKGSFKEAHFHFNWIDHPLDEFAYFQFLIIAVQSFKCEVFETYLTNTITNVYLDKPNGVPYPFWPGWTTNDIICHKTWDTTKELPFLPFDKNETKIRYNQEYDECIVNGKDKNVDICPPGVLFQTHLHFVLPNVTRERMGYLENTKLRPCRTCGQYTLTVDPCATDSNSDCCPESNMTKETSTPKENASMLSTTESAETTTSIKRISIELQTAVWTTHILNRLHGLSMIFCWTFPAAIGYFYARFMKERGPITGGSVLFGIGDWNVQHLVYSYVSLCGLMTGILMMFAYDKSAICGAYELDKVSNCLVNSKPHILLGGTAMLFFFLAYATGWWRPEEPKTRSLIILVHVVGGYASKFLSLMSVFLTKLDMKVIYCWIASEVCFTIVFILATVVQLKMDSGQGILPKRKWCPVLEAIETHRHSPYERLRTSLLIVNYVIQIVVFAVLYCIYTAPYWKI